MTSRSRSAADRRKTHCALTTLAFLAVVILPIVGIPCSAAAITIDNLRTEYQVNPLGIDARVPRLSWQLKASTRGVLQSAYQLRVASSEADLKAGKGLTWDSGKVLSDRSTQIAYSGPPLDSRRRYFWHVRTWTQDGTALPWSSIAWWEMALLDSAQWHAQWITTSTKPGGAPLFRREFVLHGPVKRARAYATAHGLYQLSVNGRRVSDAEFRPGFTSYNRRLQYQTYDVTALLHPGSNAVGAMVGEGWYRGKYAYTQRDLYGHDTALLVQIEIEYVDGTNERVKTDAAWKSSPGPISASSLYDGETYDARLEQPGWDSSGFDDRSWSGARVLLAPEAILVAQQGASVRPVEQLYPKDITRRPDGRLIVDMGQNMAGRICFDVQGPAGTTVTLRHGEVLAPDGDLYTGNLMGAAQTVKYTLKGQGIEHYAPHFTFQGFRYVEITGYPGTLTADHIVAQALHSDVQATGEFTTSNSLLNQLQHNIVWSMKSNFLEIPTDNPQRAERLGWTADAQLFAPTAAFNADVALFFTKWLQDLAADQSPRGSVPWTIPDTLREREKGIALTIGEEMPIPPRRRLTEDADDRPGAAVWGDAAVLIPWSLYLAYGDQRILENQYNSMVHWVQYERDRAGQDLIWAGDFQFADWLDFGAERRKRHGATSADLVATAYFAHSVDVLSRVANVLGKTNDAQMYARLFADLRSAFQRTYVTFGSRVGEGTQTAQVLALQFDLLEPGDRHAAARLLAEDVSRRGHLTSGLAGVSWILFALSDNGYLDEAYRLLMREQYPSWLYQVRQGATTVWERWDSIRPDGSIQTESGMNSLNQYVYGAVGAWMYRTIAGINIDPALPGYKHIVIHPQPGGGLTGAAAMYSSLYGKVASSWKISNGFFRVSVEIPPNTTSDVVLPSALRERLLEGNRPVTASNGVRAIRQQGSNVIIEVGSGVYQFSYPIARDH